MTAAIHGAGHNVTAIGEWLGERGLCPDEVDLYFYDDVAATSRARVAVGAGADRLGRTVGFAVETVPGEGVIDGLILTDDLLIEGHGLAAAIARETGRGLLDILRDVQHAGRARGAYGGH